MNDITKLPKWAQDYICELERQAKEAKRTLREFLDKQTPSPVWVDDHTCLEAKGEPTLIKNYLQTDRVTFSIGEGQDIEVRVIGNTLSVHSNWQRLIISPEVSNHIIVEVKE